MEHKPSRMVMLVDASETCLWVYRLRYTDTGRLVMRHNGRRMCPVETLPMVDVREAKERGRALAHRLGLRCYNGNS